MSANTYIRRLSILVITPFFKPNVGGVEVHLEDLCSFLVERGHRVFVITYQPLTDRVTGPALERKGNLEVRRIRWFGYNWFYKLEPYPVLQTLYVLPGLLLYSLIFLSLHRTFIDVIHTHGYIASLAGRLIRLIHRKRLVGSIHTTYKLPLGLNPWLSKVFAFILNGFDRVLVISEAGKRELIRYGVDSNKISAFTYWADTDRFRPLNKDYCKKILGLDCNFLVLFVGRLIYIKGAQVLVRSAELVDQSIYFAFITTGDLQDFLRMTNKTKLPRNVVYIGKVDHSRLHLYYNAADILVVPSQKAEGFARVCIEAMLCGTPVLASNVGYLSQVINGNVGELVSPPTAEKFAERINYYFKNRDALTNLSAQCLKYAREHFAKSNALKIEEAYYA